MKSESKPGPGGEKSRRAFVQKIGMVAAASSLAAGVSIAQQSNLPGAGVRPNLDFVPQAGSLAKQPMPTMKLGKHQVGRLILGVNGVGLHYSNPLLRSYREWNTPEQQMLSYKHCEELGINMRIQTQGQINRYNEKYGGKMLFSCNAFCPILPDGSVGDPTPMVKKLAALGPIAIHYSAAEVGQPPTEGHSQYYGGEIAWVRGDPPKMLKVIKQVKTPCVAFKILASGNLMANAKPKVQQQTVEARFKYVFENIKSTDGVVVAMWNKYEDQSALNKEYVVKYSGLSVRV